MRLNVQQEDLHRGLRAVSRAVPARSTLPITSNILIEAGNDDAGRGSLKLSATDAETIAITYTIEAEVEEDGAITLPSRLLSDFVATLPPEPIELSLAERSRQVSLVCARNEASIGGMAAEDFPPIPPVEDGDTIPLDPGALRRSIDYVAFAAATDDSRPVLTGVHFGIREGALKLAAADGFRLAVHTVALSGEPPEREAVVPARALDELGRLLSERARLHRLHSERQRLIDGIRRDAAVAEADETDEEAPRRIGDAAEQLPDADSGQDENMVQMTFNAASTQVLFDLGYATLSAQLVQGSFPNYEQLIPTSHTTRTEVGLGEFTRETRIASIFARDGSGIVRLVASPGADGAPGQLTVTARGESGGDQGGSNEGLIDALVEGEEAKIAFNSRYLTEVLQALGSDRVTIETTSPSSPGVLRPVGDDDYVHVVMPMFVQW